MSTHHVSVGPAAGPHGRSARAEIVAAWAGIVGPLLFTATFLAQDIVRRPDFDPFAEPVSALEAGPHGWVQQANFVVFGILTLIHALGLHRTLGPTRGGWTGPFLLGVSGVALLWAAVFPLREDANGATYDPGLHFAGGVLFFSTSALALLALSHRLARGSGPSCPRQVRRSDRSGRLRRLPHARPAGDPRGHAVAPMGGRGPAPAAPAGALPVPGRDRRARPPADIVTRPGAVRRATPASVRSGWRRRCVRRTSPPWHGVVLRRAAPLPAPRRSRPRPT